MSAQINFRFLPLFSLLFALSIIFSTDSVAQVTSETPTATPIAPTPGIAPTPTIVPTPPPGSTATPVPTMAPTPIDETPTATPVANVPPRIASSRDIVRVGVGETALLLIGAEDPDGSNLASLSIGLHELFSVVNSTFIGPFFTATLEIRGEEAFIGRNVMEITVGDSGNPPLSTTHTIDIIIERRGFDEAVIAHGYGGRTNVTFRSVDERADLDRNGLLDVRDRLGVVASYDAMPPLFEAIVGGGTDREVHLASGDLNNDGVKEMVTTFGPATDAFTANSANMMIVRNATGRVEFPPLGGIYRTDDPGSIVNYPTGEMRAAVGDFIGSPTNNQIALAQGLNGKGVIRLIQYNGSTDFTNGDQAWDVVGQLFGTAIPDLNIDSGLALSDAFSGAWTQNANGGVTLAAGDFDGDGIDELAVGQTRSSTSRGTLQILEFGDPNPLLNNVVFDAQYFEYNPFDVLEPFLGDFRGDGGVNLAAGDLDGDGTPELIVTSQGDSSQNASAKNWILILKAISQNGRVTGFSIVPNGLLSALTAPADANPSNALSVGTGEFTGFSSDGAEIIVGSQAIVDYNGMTAQVSLAPQQSQYVLLDVEFDANGAVSSTTNLIVPGRAEGFNAYVGIWEPSSHSVSVAGFDALSLDDL